MRLTRILPVATLVAGSLLHATPAAADHVTCGSSTVGGYATRPNDGLVSTAVALVAFAEFACEMDVLNTAPSEYLDWTATLHIEIQTAGGESICGAGLALRVVGPFARNAFVHHCFVETGSPHYRDEFVAIATMTLSGVGWDESFTRTEPLVRVP